MTSERHSRISDLFLAACELDASERDAFLNHECAGDDELRVAVDSLLERDAQPAAVDRPLIDTIMRHDLESGSAQRWIPQQIGQYEILDQLGRGGMGVVFRARQGHPPRTVALKMIHQANFSPRVIRRFEFEAEVLARLKHPGIAQIFDAGTAEGPFGPQPYFAMELVDGVPLTDHMRDAGLDIRARLALLADVCDAVHHAHQQGVIHRDLKPANILVEKSGLPKILDFGVARVSDQDLTVTAEGGVAQVLGTLPYMSPEQIRGSRDDVDIRSDVYSLGVIAYEILSGRLPYDLRSTNIAEAARIVHDESVPPVGAVVPACRGDVETIVQKALAKEKEQRYTSAADLAADIRHYLQNEPIIARPATTLYHFRKLVSRHRLPFALAASLFVVAIAFGAWMSLLYSRAERERVRAAEAEVLKSQEAERANQAGERARREAALAQRVQGFLIDLFETNDPDEALAATITVREVLDRGAERVAGELAQEPTVQLEMMDVIGQVYLKLSLYERAKQLASQSLEIRRRMFGASHAEVAKSLEWLAQAVKSESDYERATELASEAVDISVNRLPDDHPATARRLVLLGELQTTTGHLDASEKSLTTALDMQRRLFGTEHEDLVETLNQFMYLRLAQDRLDEAVEIGRELLRVCSKVHGDRHTATAGAKATLGDMLRRVGALDEAEVVTREGLRTFRDLLEPNHPHIAATANNLALVLKDKKQYEEAKRLMNEALEVRRSRYGPRHAHVAQSLFNLASLMLELHENAEAEPLLAEALSILEEHFDEHHRHVLLLRYQLGLAILKQKRFAEAEPVLRQVLEGYEQTLPRGHRFIAYTQGLLGGALVQLNRFDEAEPLLLASWDTLRAEGNKSRMDRAAERLVELYTGWDKPDLAAQYRTSDDRGAAQKPH